MESRGITGRLTLTLLRNQGDNDLVVRVISDNVLDDGEWHSWVVNSDDAPGGTYRLKLHSNDDPDVSALSPYFAVGAGLSLLSPVRTACLTPGSRPRITWRTAGLGGDIRLLLSGPNGVVRTIRGRAADSGRFDDWRVPDNMIQGDGYRVRAISRQNSAVRAVSKPFAIGGRIEVLSPFEGDVVAIGSRPRIRWRSENVFGRMRIELRRGTRTLRQVIAENAINNGSFTQWRVPPIDDEGIGFRIVVASSDDPGIFGISTTFQIGTRFQWLNPTYEQVEFIGAPNIRPAFFPFDSTPLLHWRRMGDHHGPLKIKLVRGNTRLTIASNVEDGPGSTSRFDGWTVSRDLVAASNYQLILSPRNNQAKMRFKSHPFHLGAMIDVGPLSTAGGRVTSLALKGRAYRVVWRTLGLSSLVQIDLISNQGKIDFSNRVTTFDTGEHDWTMSGELKSDTLYRFRVKSKTHPGVFGWGPWFELVD